MSMYLIANYLKTKIAHTASVASPVVSPDVATIIASVANGIILFGCKTRIVLKQNGSVRRKP